MRFIIVTGMSGAGKTLALKFLEDIGYYCVDNLPPQLLPKFAEVCFKQGSDIERVALGIDIRGGKLFDDFFIGLNDIKNEYPYDIMYLDASDEILLTRYKETRRNHPLAKGDRLIHGIQLERELLQKVKKHSTYIIDTSFCLTRQLKEKINDIFLDDKIFNSLMINVISFGFKYGIPADSDLVFDVRFIPNPFYDSKLKPLNGNDEPVRNYVMQFEESNVFLDKLKDMLDFLLPNYIKEGKNSLVISIGCTGGKHRSVVLANEFHKYMLSLGNSSVINHRDIYNDVNLSNQEFNLITTPLEKSED